MYSIKERTWKKEALLGVALPAFLVAAIITGIYAANPTDATQVSSNTSTQNDVDMHVDVSVESGLIDPQSITSSIQFDTSALKTDAEAVAGQTSPDVTVSIDGAPITVPESGTVHKEITTDDGTTSVDISTQSSSSSGDSRTRSSINIDVDSSVRIRNETSE